MPPSFIDEFEFYNNRCRCAYFGRKKIGFKCGHPKRQIESCESPVNCPATQKQWDELVLNKEVEFRPYVEMA